MGEASRRKSEIQKLKSRESDWLTSLQGNARTVAQVAIAALNNIIVQHDLTGGCYNMAFFMREYLSRQHGIEVEMVVGWVTDDSWSGGMSHAWIEHNGKRTDISIWKTEFPEQQLPGAVIIEDFEYRKGVAHYTYHRDLPKTARDYLDMASQDAQVGLIYKKKDAEHCEMQRLATDTDGAEQYFSRAPQEMKYESLASMLRGI
ncbi:MAG: hypothetical protein V4542_13955 [Pseudomonadota bacterium]